MSDFGLEKLYQQTVIVHFSYQCLKKLSVGKKLERIRNLRNLNIPLSNIKQNQINYREKMYSMKIQTIFSIIQYHFINKK